VAVNLNSPHRADLKPVDGVELGVAAAGIRKRDRNDLMLMRLATGSRVAGVFTQNAFAAAPVQVSRRRLAAGGEIRALLTNAGNANCGTGEPGLRAAEASCAAAARALDCRPEQVLPFSTGVILEPLPVERIETALPECVATLAADNWLEAARAIMTTDTVPKGASRTVELDGQTVTATGIAKGVGMLAPDMATMLAYIATDAALGQKTLERLARAVAAVSFNRVTVDGDTSTNDSFMLVATGRAGHRDIESCDDVRYEMVQQAVIEVAQQLAQAIARDGEGATKFITLHVGGAADEAEAVRVARSVANSPLVKTAFFASDPNLGRLIMAIGNTGLTDFDTSRVELSLGHLKVIERGHRAPSYRDEDGVRAMQPAEIVLRIDLGRGAAETTVWTCDLSYAYVKINAEYRT
jgi:glutamate N-acetyltransferase / amino-acid N-acetyltransferase